METMSDVESVDESGDDQWCSDAQGLHRHASSVFPHQPLALSIISRGFSIGKTTESNEDAFFVSDRSFGIADGVSGWVDFGFSSRAFSNQLMDSCKTEIENFDE